MLKEIRGIKPVMVVQVGRKIFKTPQSLARELAWSVAARLERKIRTYSPAKLIDFYDLRERAYRRIFPHCKWFYHRK